MFKNNKKGIIALALVLVLAVAALFVWQAAKPEKKQYPNCYFLSVFRRYYPPLTIILQRYGAFGIIT